MSIIVSLAGRLAVELTASLSRFVKWDLGACEKKQVMLEKMVVNTRLSSIVVDGYSLIKELIIPSSFGNLYLSLKY